MKGIDDSPMIWAAAPGRRLDHRWTAGGRRCPGGLTVARRSKRAALRKEQSQSRRIP